VTPGLPAGMEAIIVEEEGGAAGAPGRAIDGGRLGAGTATLRMATHAELDRLAQARYDADPHSFLSWCYCGPCAARRRVAGERAEEVAAALLGTKLWETATRQRYLDVPSSLHAGMTYRVWWGRSIEVFTDTVRVWAVPRRATRRPPWRRARWRRGPNAPVAGKKIHAYNLCVGPATLMPVAEAFAHLYLYARDCPERLHRDGNDVGFSSFATPNTF